MITINKYLEHMHYVEYWEARCKHLENCLAEKRAITNHLKEQLLELEKEHVDLRNFKLETER